MREQHSAYFLIVDNNFAYMSPRLSRFLRNNMIMTCFLGD